MRLAIATKDGATYRTDRLGRDGAVCEAVLSEARDLGFLGVDYYDPDRTGLEEADPSTRVFLRTVWIPWDNVAAVVTVGPDAKTAPLGEDGWVEWPDTVDPFAGVFEGDLPESEPEDGRCGYHDETKFCMACAGSPLDETKHAVACDTGDDDHNGPCQWPNPANAGVDKSGAYGPGLDRCATACNGGHLAGFDVGDCDANVDVVDKSSAYGIPGCG